MRNILICWTLRLFFAQICHFTKKNGIFSYLSRRKLCYTIITVYAFFFLRPLRVYKVLTVPSYVLSYNINFNHSLIKPSKCWKIKSRNICCLHKIYFRYESCHSTLIYDLAPFILVCFINLALASKIANYDIRSTLTSCEKYWIISTWAFSFDFRLITSQWQIEHDRSLDEYICAHE